MMNTSKFMSLVENSVLKGSVSEAMAWRKTGMLSGVNLTSIAEKLALELGITEDDAIRQADTLVMEEAARRFSAKPEEGRYAAFIASLPMADKHSAEQVEIAVASIEATINYLKSIGVFPFGIAFAMGLSINDIGKAADWSESMRQEFIGDAIIRLTENQSS